MVGFIKPPFLSTGTGFVPVAPRGIGVGTSEPPPPVITYMLRGIGNGWNVQEDAYAMFPFTLPDSYVAGEDITVTFDIEPRVAHATNQIGALAATLDGGSIEEADYTVDGFGFAPGQALVLFMRQQTDPTTLTSAQFGALKLGNLSPSLIVGGFRQNVVCTIPGINLDSGRSSTTNYVNYGTQPSPNRLHNVNGGVVMVDGADVPALSSANFPPGTWHAGWAYKPTLANVAGKYGFTQSTTIAGPYSGNPYSTGAADIPGWVGLNGIPAGSVSLQPGQTISICWHSFVNAGPGPYIYGITVHAGGEDFPIDIQTVYADSLLYKPVPPPRLVYEFDITPHNYALQTVTELVPPLPTIENFIPEPWGIDTENLFANPGTVEGDLIAFFGVFSQPGNVAPVVIPPAGWLPIPGATKWPRTDGGITAGIYAWYKIATASEPALYTFAHQNDDPYSSQSTMLLIRGADQDIPFSPVSTFNFGFGQNATATGLTLINNSLVIDQVFCWTAAQTPTNPPGFDMIDNGPVMYLANASRSILGTTGNVVSNHPLNAADYWAASLYAIQGAITPPIPKIESETSIPWTSKNESTWTAPTDVQEGDVLALFALWGQNGVDVAIPIPPDESWIECPGERLPHDDGSFTCNLFAWYKIATANEPADYTWAHTADAAYYSTGSMLAIRGADQNNPFTDNATFAIGAGTDVVTPGLYAPASSLLLDQVMCWAGAQTPYPPTGFTEVFNGVMYLAKAPKQVAGATGNIDSYHPLNGGQTWMAALYAVQSGG